MSAETKKGTEQQVNMAQPEKGAKLIGIDRVIAKTRRSGVLRVVEGYKSKPVLDLLAMTNQDVADALTFCETIGIDLEPVSRMMGDETRTEVFYNYLREYLVALEICLDAGRGIGNTVILWHPNSCLKEAAEKFGRKVETQESYVHKKGLIEKFRSWVEERT